MVSSYIAESLKEALSLRAEKTVVPYGGGTDLMIEAPDDASYLFLGKIPELRRITLDDEYIRIGAGCTFTELIESSLIPDILKDAASGVGGPAIRNLGTVGGNIGNGSAKADCALIFFAADCRLRLMSAEHERILPIKDFYLGRKQIDLRSDELIVEVLLPRSDYSNYYYKKIGARNAQAISRVAFAAVLSTEDGRINHLATAFGSVSDVIIRRDDIDAMMTGKTMAEASSIRDAYLFAYDEAIVPISGRISAEYRKSVCMNLLRDFLDSNSI